MATTGPNLWRDARLIDPIVRASGILLLGCAALAIVLLLRVIGGRLHEATPAELLLAACGFLSASAGMMALTAGRGLFERIALPRRSGFADWPASASTPSGVPAIWIDTSSNEIGNEANRPRQNPADQAIARDSMQRCASSHCRTPVPA